MSAQYDEPIPQYVLVTRYVRSGGKALVHTYGMYTKDRALARRKALLRQHAAQDQSATLEVSVCMVLDPSGKGLAMNQPGQAIR